MKKVVRKKPSWRFRRKTDLNLVDMHTHTDYSDANFTAKQLIRKCLRKNIGVAVTDHNEIKGCLEVYDSDVFCIPAIEITSLESMDFLVYFYNIEDLKDFYLKYVKGCRVVPSVVDYNLLKWKTEDLLKKVKQYKCVVVLPHPDTIEPKKSYRYFNLHPELIKYLDAIEVVNSLLNKKSNLLAYHWAKKLDIPMTGGSDAHALRGVGCAVTLSDGFTIKSFLDNIKNGKCFVRGKSMAGVAWMQNVYTLSKKMLIWKKRV